jgi:hypothetical protein
MCKQAWKDDWNSQKMAETVSYLRLAAGSGTTLVEQVRPALGWRCRCSLFHLREARNGTSFGVEHLRDLVWSSRSSEQGDTVFAILAFSHIAGAAATIHLYPLAIAPPPI